MASPACCNVIIEEGTEKVCRCLLLACKISFPSPRTNAEHTNSVAPTSLWRTGYPRDVVLSEH